MSDSIRIIVSKGDAVIDDVSLAFATQADNEALPADVLDLLMASAVWHLSSSRPAEFSMNEDGTVRWTWLNPDFNAQQPESDTNQRTLFADMTAARCVSVCLRQFGEKLIAGRNNSLAMLQAQQQAAVASQMTVAAVTVIEV